MRRGQPDPSTDQSAYLTPTDPDVSIVPLLSAGDTVSGATMASGAQWRFAGIPDGLGAFDNHDGTMTVLVNHELPSDGGDRTTLARKAAPSSIAS